MAPSQLKRLRSSLREHGVIGLQKSKKQKKQATQSGSLQESRSQRNVALQGIREHFNPFEVKPASRSKYDFASSKVAAGRVEKGATSRPGVTKGLGEENRRKTLLLEMQKRKKVGGIMDRRFGESDPTMTPEAKALERFVQERQRGSKKESLFDLEDAEEEQLTHFGQSLSFDQPARDDFVENDINSSEDEGIGEEQPRKRRKMSDSDVSSNTSVDNDPEAGSERSKSRKEVMEEVIAKSKLHRYERQQAKEDDDDLRAELDKGLPDIYALMYGSARQPVHLLNAEMPSTVSNGAINPDRMALLQGKDRSQADKEYDERLRQMSMDQRAKPTVRTLTNEEKVQKEAERLNELEANRLQRMKGGPYFESEMDEDKEVANGDEEPHQSNEYNFGLGSGLTNQQGHFELGVEDEDEFVIDDALIDDDSDLDRHDEESESESHSRESNSRKVGDDEFVRGLLSTEDLDREGLSFSIDQSGLAPENGVSKNLAYTFQCPLTHAELLKVTGTESIDDLPTIIQRIRALYHPSLAAENKAKLQKFSTVLVEHLAYLADCPNHPSFSVLAALIRHIHSLAKTFPDSVGRACRKHLKAIEEARPTSLTPGDLMILTAIASVFPTSDHFHQVVTPAMLCMCRFLEQQGPNSLSEVATGTYIVTLCAKYQRISKRYVPEMVNFLSNSILALAPRIIDRPKGGILCHAWSKYVRMQGSSTSRPNHRLSFWDILPHPSNDNNDSLKEALLNTQLVLIDTIVDLWSERLSFCEIFSPLYTVLQNLGPESISGRISGIVGTRTRELVIKIHQRLVQARVARKPLRLHNHRPLAIKTSVPKFEESYNPDKHYDPDRDRAESSKLKAEHKRERKGALRELRKDANFVARENLREKKERDSAYEKKYKRLVAEIQGEEGREANQYEREKRMRKGKK
ncbi:nucleolar complex protein 14 [Puttea exsequens]|nr:nucleolar complex protein 14 [Puttea exsequens]